LRLLDEGPVIDLPRYSALEIERRWLVDLSAVGDLGGTPYREVEDLYIGGSRLRLRKMTDLNGEAVFKLGKKYGKRSPGTEPITTLYLTEAEYRLLSSLPGMSTSKRRYSVADGSLDIYQRPHSGLAIFEIEFEDDASAQSYRPPPFVTQEITGDATFSGFALAEGNE
jgi:CYTH domain-containing protein